MKKDIESVSSDKQDWKQYVFMTEEQRKKLIEDKVKRVFKQLELEKKTKVFSK